MNQRKLVYLINGANLSRLGSREPEIYGSTSLEEIEESFKQKAKSAGYEAVCMQSESEGEIVSAIHKAIDDGAAIVINPAAFTHYSYAIADAISQAPGPVIEVHITNPYAREEWRRRSVVSPYVTGTIAGFGAHSYLLALDAITEIDTRSNPVGSTESSAE
jgi:3-dehydroquinate dehydratase-2